MKNQIEALEQQRQNIACKSLRNLLQEYGSDEVLSESVRKNKFLVFLLRRGYIDENYANFINYFKGTSITKDDMDFVLAVKNMEPLPFEYPLTKLPQIVQRLQPYEFQERAIYNFSLLDYLLGSQEFKEKRTLFIKQLADEDERSWQFIDGFIRRAKKLETFIPLLTGSWIGMWTYIYNHNIMPYERKAYYLSLLITYVDIDLLIEMDSQKNNIGTFFETNKTILQSLASVDGDRICTVIESFGINFYDVFLENVPAEIVEYIISTNRYEINPTMLERVVQYENIILSEDMNIKPYSILIELANEFVLDYIKSNIVVFVEQVLTQGDFLDSEADVIDLLEQTLDDVKLFSQVLSHERICFEDILSCCGRLVSQKKKEINRLWDYIFQNERIKLNWKNIYRYWEQFGFSNQLLEYIRTHVVELVDTNTDFLDDDFIGEFLQSDIEEHAFEKLIPLVRMDEFTVPLESLSESRVYTLIQCNYFNFSVPLYEKIKKAFPELCVSFILFNQQEFAKALEEIPITQETFESLLLSDRLEHGIGQQLLSLYGVKFMTEKIAKHIATTKYELTTPMFNAAWELIDDLKKEELMFAYLHLLDDDNIYNCFSCLGGLYSEFLDRSKRHSVTIEYTVENRRLAKRLEEVKYITSFKEVEIQGRSEKTKRGKRKGIQCWIKAES